MNRKMRYSICITVLLAFLLSLSPVMARPDQDKGRGAGKKIEKMDKRAEKRAEKALVKAEKKSAKAEKKARKQERREKIRKTENAIEKLKEVAGKLEEKGKTEEAARLRGKIVALEKRLAEKKGKINQDDGDEK